MEDQTAELEALRAENRRLMAEREARPKVDGGLSNLARHASRQDAAYRAIQAGGLDGAVSTEVLPAEVQETAHEAAGYLLQDWGLA